MLVQEGLECPTKDEFDHFDKDKNGVLTWSEWVSFQEWGQSKKWIDDVFWYIVNLDLNLKYIYIDCLELLELLYVLWSP